MSVTAIEASYVLRDSQARGHFAGGILDGPHGTTAVVPLVLQANRCPDSFLLPVIQHSLGLIYDQGLYLRSVNKPHKR